MWTKGEQIGLVRHEREFGAPEHLDQLRPGEGAQIEFDRLNEAREVRNDEDAFVCDFNLPCRLRRLWPAFGSNPENPRGWRCSKKAR